MSTPMRPAVLVVEDELLLRIDAAEMIEDAGFEALQAADGDEAIEILEGRPDIKVILLTYKSPARWTASSLRTRYVGDGRR